MCVCVVTLKVHTIVGEEGKMGLDEEEIRLLAIIALGIDHHTERKREEKQKHPCSNNR